MENLCSKCGAPYKEGQKFCRKCGNKLTVPVKEEKTFCPECGAECLSTDNNCPECGASLKEDQSSEPWGTSSDGWGDVLGNLSAYEEAERLAAFEYEKRHDGSVVLTGLKDKYAFSVKVPDGVTVIGDGAFSGSEVIEVELPEGLTAIGKRAFCGCPNLKQINIPAAVLLIGEEAFADCAELTVKVPKTVRVLGKDALRGTAGALCDSELLRERDLVERYFTDSHFPYHFNIKRYSVKLPRTVAMVEKGELTDVKCRGWYYETREDWSSAVKVYEAAADKGDAFAKYRLGWCYYYGKGVKGDDGKAILLFEEAMKDGCDYAVASYIQEVKRQTEIGDEDYYDVDDAYREVCKSAEGGFALSRYWEATFYDYDDWESKKSGYFILQELAEGGLAAAMHDLARYAGTYYDGDFNPDALKVGFKWAQEYQRLVGNADSYCVLAECYMDGNGVEADDERALHYYRKAADEGNDEAMYQLGIYYLRGCDCLKADEQTAITWLQRAKEAGSVIAEIKLEQIEKKKKREAEEREKKLAEEQSKRAEEERIEQVKKDLPFGISLYHNELYEDAYEYILPAAQLDIPDGLYYLGLYCINGFIAEIDKDRAFKLFGKAAALGHNEAKFFLGNMYITGGTYADKDEARGIRLTRESAEGGYWRASYYMSVYCRYGMHGLSKDPTRAFIWSSKACEQKKNALTLSSLADHYLYGLGTKQDTYTAFLLYKQAIEAGGKGLGIVHFQLAQLYLEGKGGVEHSLAKAVEHLKLARDDGNESARKQLASMGY